MAYDRAEIPREGYLYEGQIMGKQEFCNAMDAAKKEILAAWDSMTPVERALATLLLVHPTKFDVSIESATGAATDTAPAEK